VLATGLIVLNSYKVIMKVTDEFTAACQALGKNDPTLTELNLEEYPYDNSLLLDRKRVKQLVQALEKNTFVEKLTLPDHLCVNSTLQLSHFLRTSPSLRRLDMCGEEQHPKDDELKDTLMKTSIVFESISRSSLLVKLNLCDVLFGDDCPLEGFLSSTRTLLELKYYQRYSTMTHQVAQAVASGLEQNKSLVKLRWMNAYQGDDFFEEILLGLFDHASLKTLELTVRLTKSSSQALRALLHCNRKLELLHLKQLQDREKTPTMVSVLAGLARNTGLKKVTFYTNCGGETEAVLATAWTSMIQRNTSIKILDLRNNDGEDTEDCELCSAVAEGLVSNFTLDTLYLPGWSNSNPEVFHGPVWQEMFESNHCLKKLDFPASSISLKALQCIARGLSQNTSLESIDLGYTNMTNDCVIALVDALSTNKTLKYLDLSNNCELSQSGMAAIERLIGYNVLKELNLANNSNTVGASILNIGLSNNRSLEKLILENTFVNDEGPETFRALCERLRGNTTLRHLDVKDNRVRLDGVCVTALKLDTMSLETLRLDCNSFTCCGITALAQSLQGPCALRELNLYGCDLDDAGLLKLGEALTTNVSLEVLNVSANNCTHNGACQFFELLPQMKGLKAAYGLVFEKDTYFPTEAVGTTLLDGLRENTKLQEICDGTDGTVNFYFPPGIARGIDFYLSLNRHGRMLLQPPGGSEPPSGLWPRVLAKITGPRDMSLLFYFLQNKPKIVNWNAPVNRKRKNASLD
jgi:Ran GTPase-activating protein (RanGAP) involved in mRNA processing and transport